MKAENAAFRTRSRNGAAVPAFAGSFARTRVPARPRAPLVDFTVRCGRDLSTTNPLRWHYKVSSADRAGTAWYPSNQGASTRVAATIRDGHLEKYPLASRGQIRFCDSRDDADGD